MIITKNLLDPQVVTLLDKGRLVVAKTDTIYGVLAKADDRAAVELLYQVKKRDANKPCILLVSKISNIPGLTKHQADTYVKLQENRPTTLVKQVDESFMAHLPRSHDSLAFRVVSAYPLKDLVDVTGPLLAPSANPQGKPTAKSIDQAIEYFDSNVSAYVDNGEVANSQPSQIIKFKDTSASYTIIRS